jgi:hypothetical protein
MCCAFYGSQHPLYATLIPMIKLPNKHDIIKHMRSDRNTALTTLQQELIKHVYG